MRKQSNSNDEFHNLPCCATEFINLVIRKMRYRKKVRADVRAELAAHFEDALKDCQTDEEKEQLAQKLIADFGDAKMLAKLLRRGKKRCRSIWQKILVRSSQIAGLLVLYVLIRIGYLATGTATISVNYIDWLNEIVQAGRVESDNALPYYEKAAEACVKMPDWLSKNTAKWPTDLNDAELKDLSGWLANNKQALEMLRKGTQRPYYWVTYNSDEEELARMGVPDNVMKPLSGYRNLACTIAWEIRYQAYSGNVDKALGDCIILCRFAQHQQGKHLLVEQLVGVTIEALGTGCAFDVFDRTDISAGQLGLFQKKFEQAIVSDVIDFGAEKAFFYDLVQRSFTDDGTGNGRMLLRGLHFAGSSPKSILFNFFTMSLPDRREVISKIEAYYDRANKMMQKTPYQSRRESVSYEEVGNQLTGILLVDLMGPAFERVTELLWRLRVSRQALVTTAAILRYQREKGQYPEGLNQLRAAGYIKQLPMDPYNDKPLVYKRNGEDFILYSFGADFDDDGGVENPKDQWGQKPEGGDRVFWPVSRRD